MYIGFDKEKNVPRGNLKENPRKIFFTLKKRRRKTNLTREICAMRKLNENLKYC